MKKGMKWFLALLALGFVINVLSKNNTPQTPEEKAQQEQAALKEATRKAYFEHPVVKAQEVAHKLDAINGQHAPEIQPAIQNMQQFVTSKGRTPLDGRLAGNAAVAFDALHTAYAKFDVPMNLPGDAAPLLTGARVALKNSAQAGTEAFLELQRMVEGKATSSMALINRKLDSAITLRNEGVAKLQKAQEQLKTMSVPIYPN